MANSRKRLPYRQGVAVPTNVPSFILKKLYVKGSFKNTAHGFQISLNNFLAPGTLLKISPIQIDGRNVPLEQIQIVVGNTPPVRASAISIQSPSAFPLNTIITFLVQDQPLTPGPHRLTVQIDTQEVGELRIDAEDTIE